jgi:N-methylhydantoinase A/oxoprolinase/acetone carboxylase beta subunit
VAGTNTDGVLLDPTTQQILATHKSPTTSNPSLGIQTTIQALLQSVTVSAQDVASVTIGTTHFINAVVERDETRLSKVAVIRLVGPFAKLPPCVDWDEDMRELVLGHYALVKGGLEVR